MKKQTINHSKEIISDSNNTLFLDRDGVINRKLENDYVKNWDEFEFIDGVLKALKVFNSLFEHIIIVTNQQGIGKGLMTEKDLDLIHSKMLLAIEKAGGRIDKIYFAPQLAAEKSNFRKPNTGMPLQAQKDCSTINFEKSIMVGDSVSDMEMGQKLGMICVGIGNDELNCDLFCDSLSGFVDLVIENS